LAEHALGCANRRPENALGCEPDGNLRRIASLPDVVLRADYPAIIARWSKFVPEERIHILFMDDILTKPLELMSDVCKFL